MAAHATTPPALALLSAHDVQDLTHAIRAANMTFVRVEAALLRVEKALSRVESAITKSTHVDTEPMIGPAVQLEPGMY